jgi:hypothetical protein
MICCGSGWESFGSDDSFSGSESKYKSGTGSRPYLAHFFNQEYLNKILFFILEVALIPDPGSKRSRIQILLKEFKYF